MAYRNASHYALVVVLFLSWCASATIAADPDHGEATPSPFSGTFVNSLVTLIVFLLALGVLRKFAWGPILSALQKRETFIHDSLAQAKSDREQAEARLKEYTAKLDDARAEATAIVEEGRRDAEAVRQRVQSEAKSEADALLARAKREIALARDEAIKELYNQTAEMATLAAGRVLQKELSQEEHNRLLAQSLEEMKQLGGNGVSR